LSKKPAAQVSIKLACGYYTHRAWMVFISKLVSIVSTHFKRAIFP
jgi:hypothetical protein